MMQSQSQSQSLLVLSFLLCLATTTILSKTINIVSNSNEIVKVVLSNSHRRNYVLAEALTPQYQPSAVRASRRTSTASLSISSIELPFSSTTIGHPHHHRPHKGKGNDAAVAEKTKTNAAVDITIPMSILSYSTYRIIIINIIIVNRTLYQQQLLLLLRLLPQQAQQQEQQLILPTNDQDMEAVVVDVYNEDYIF